MKSADYYEVLGVPKDATPDDLKSARRRRAHAAHPDKRGGSKDEEEMKEINHAFDVLIDPKRRLLYDKTGQDAQKPVEVEARNLIMQAFGAALSKDHPNALLYAREYFEKGIETLGGNIHRFQATKAKLLKRRNKIKTKKKAQNLFHMLIDQEVERITLAIGQFEEDVKICREAVRQLDFYETSEEMPSLVTEWPFSGGKPFHKLDITAIFQDELKKILEKEGGIHE